MHKCFASNIHHFELTRISNFRLFVSSYAKEQIEQQAAVVSQRNRTQLIYVVSDLIPFYINQTKVEK